MDTQLEEQPSLPELEAELLGAPRFAHSWLPGLSSTTVRYHAQVTANGL